VPLIVAGLLFVGSAAFATQDVHAACGGPFIEDFLDAYDFSRADDIVLGRLIERDPDDERIHFQALTVYRGSAPSPLDADDIVEVGRCITRPEPGGRFIYVAGDKRFGPNGLIFTHLPEHGWLVDPPDGFWSLDDLLVLLGALPDTSTASPLEAPTGTVGPDLGVVVVALIALVAGMMFPSRARSRLSDSRDIWRR
jgi:hypothetical protein